MRSIRRSTTPKIQNRLTPLICLCLFATRQCPILYLLFGRLSRSQLHLKLRSKQTLFSPNRNGLVVVESTDFRTRRNQLVIVGNNRFGKGGKPRCDRCRRRRRKVSQRPSKAAFLLISSAIIHP